MVRFHERPFLEYLLEMLKRQGVARVLLLLGYLPEVIRDYFGDGRRFGLKIDYSVTQVEDETGRRLRFAAPKLDPLFLLLYCDNYWPMALGKMWQRFQSSDAPVMVTIYSNKDGYTRNNVRLDGEGYVTVYDKTRTQPGLNGVEIGYALVKREVLDLLPDENVAFEHAVYPRLAGERRLLGYITDHRYYSVGSFQRLPLTEAFLATKRVVILDRDGVLNKKPPKAEYVRRWEEFYWLPGAVEALQLFKQSGFQVVLITNQAGIARGVMTEADLAAIHERMQAELAKGGASVDRIYHCPHGWDEGCECRKPKPGMLFQAQRDLHLDLTQTCFIGDDERDAQAADAAGCPCMLVSDKLSLLDCARQLVSAQH
jgi:D-glycero-D-manno-heptose 1,7-bisphosphate phosphatase